MVWFPHWPLFRSNFDRKFVLDRINLLLEKLGSPHKKLPPVIHVGGTNGKGSTIAFMQAIFEAAGLKVHRYTSPHILRFNERIVLAGNEISDEYLLELLEECRAVTEREKIDISFFEGTTAAAFLAFSRVKADVLLLEVGLGGRLDATNVIENHMLSVITPISYDHENVLGETLEEIAGEKAYIMRRGKPCVVSLQTSDVHDVLERHAVRTQVSSLIRHGYDFGVSIGARDELVYRSDRLNIVLPAPVLAGYHQYINAATAIAAVSNCYSFPEEVFISGITSAKWIGRLKKIEQGRFVNCLPKEWEIWVDGAHNEGAAQALGAWVKDQSKKPTYLIIGMTKNRDVNKFLRHFKGIVSKIICVNIYSEPLSHRAEVLMNLIEDVELRGIATYAVDLEGAFDIINQQVTQNSHSRVLVTGSLFLTSDFFVGNKGRAVNFQ